MTLSDAGATASRRGLCRVWMVALLLVAAGGCFKPPSGGKSVGPKELFVGGLLSKTGGAAAYGGEADNGAVLAAEEINASATPIHVRYTSVDDKSDQTAAVKVARDLIDVGRVNVILGPAISPSAISVGKLAEERRVPIVCTSATQDEVTASDRYNREYVSRVCFNDSFQGRVLAKFAAVSLAKKTAVIVYDKTLSYSIGLSKTFRGEFGKLGGSVLQEENYSVQDTDYSPLISKVATFNADILFVPGWDENIGPMLRQAGSKWDKFIILGGDGLPTNRFLELARGNIKNVYAISHFSLSDPNEQVQRFRHAYHTKYGQDPTPFSALGYDAMMLIHAAALRAKSLSGPDLMIAINSSRDVKLVTGTLTFDQFRNPQKEAIVVQILPDRINFQERVRP